MPRRIAAAAEPPRGNWQALGRPPGRSYRLIAAALGLAGTVLAVAAVPQIGRLPAPEYLFFFVLALGGTWIVIHFPTGTSLSMQGPVTLAAVWLFGWAACVPINIASASLLLRRGVHPWRWLFAWSNTTLWMSAAGLAFQSYAGGVLQPAHGWSEALVLLAAGLLCAFGLAAAPAAALSADDGDRSRLVPRSLAHITAFIFLSFVPVSYLMAIGFQTGRGTGALLAVAVWILTSLALKGHTETGQANARLQEALLELEQLSVTDPLTRLYNRRHLASVLNKEIARHGRHGLEFSLLMIDLVGFKEVNDRHGHLEGDRALEQVGSAIRRRLREADVAFRWGGDEFAVVLPHTPGAGARTVAEALNQEIGAVVLAGGGAADRLAASVGVAVFPHHGGSPEALLGAADQALYGARERQVAVAVATVEPA